MWAPRITVKKELLLNLDRKKKKKHHGPTDADPVKGDLMPFSSEL